MKILKAFIIGIAVVLSIPVILFVNYLFDDLDFCLDTGYCKEGLTLNTEKGKIIVNKETCSDHDGIWEENILVASSLVKSIQLNSASLDSWTHPYLNN